MNFNSLTFLINHFRTTIFKQRIKPRILQMPITGRCNSRCVTCNIWKRQEGASELDPVALKQVLSDPFFAQVRLVGLNGGEPSMYKRMDELLDALFVLPKLNRIHVISNAIIEHKLTSMMEIIKAKCTGKGIRVYLTISLDGVGEMHNEVRGIPRVFEKTVATIRTINGDKQKYCDVLDIGTTLSNLNIERVVEIEEFNKSLGIPAYYHLAVPNKRLFNYNAEQTFDIMYSTRSRLLATDYFFGKFKYGKGLRTRLRAFMTYYYLKNEGEGRLAACNYLRSDVTITENLDLFLCATASDKVGNLLENSATELWKNGAMKQREIEVCGNCNTCVHYIVFPTWKGMLLFVRELLRPRIWIGYQLKALWLR